MSRRSPHIALLTLIPLMGIGGLVWLEAVRAQDQYIPTAISPTPVAPQTTKRLKSPIPAPPAGRAEGIFHLEESSPAAHKIQQALRDPRGVDIEFIDTPLKDAMDFLADAHNITILLDQVSLKGAGVELDEPINRTLSGIKLESALNIMLEPMQLTYVIEDEVMKITTKDTADAKHLTRVYHTGYLKSIGVEAEALSKTIQNVVEPGSWQTEAGGRASQASARGGNAKVLMTGALLGSVRQSGTGGEKAETPQNAINVLGDMLVISAPRSVHEKVTKLLVQIDRRWSMDEKGR